MNNKFISYLISVLIIFLYSYVFFYSIIISVVLCILISIEFHKIFEDFLNKKDIRLKRIMFREFLDIFNSNIISGQNFYNSLKTTSVEIKNIFQENTYIISYLDLLVKDIDNGKMIEQSLLIFKERSKLEEVDIFVDSLIIAIKSGIDISKITNNSKKMLSENISLELEISTILDNSKKDFLIMSILPLIILVLLNITSIKSLDYIDYIIRIPVFIIFIFSFYLGNKIVNLEV